MPTTTAKSSRRRTSRKKAASRAAIVESIRGKYRHILSTERFLREKHSEMRREDRRP